MIHYHYLDTDNKLKEYISSLHERKIERIAVDLEGEFNLHCYGEHLCLVQIYDGQEYALIDPFKVRINLIRDLMEDLNLRKIMYDCSGDRTLMFRKYGIAINSIEDLLPAAELLDLEKRNLGFVLTHFLGIQPKAKKKFQQYNWMRRPIQREALEYALDDVKYLFDLKIALLKEVAAAGLLEEYEKKNQEAQSREISMKPLPGVFKKNRFKKMPSKSRDLFKQLFDLREGYAEQLDMPPNSVVSNENIFAISQSLMTPGQIRFSGRVPRDISAKLLEEIKTLVRAEKE
ncbi:3'-5' exonuclease [Oceanispirochaeta crateris]|uniref:3'-5' exonuclease n=1 Tax=Oceanispirochaeta crateris TaxID=2518645 RepID=A0A5C1QJ97_9SPIO|nr:HRDC domain-containing protein [Oceanispirochaeta crateris]QEN07070.1 3'-5' exonuclease [Oceanispirochaeta crateris]